MPRTGKGSGTGEVNRRHQRDVRQEKKKKKKTVGPIDRNTMKDSLGQGVTQKGGHEEEAFLKKNRNTKGRQLKWGVNVEGSGNATRIVQDSRATKVSKPGERRERGEKSGQDAFVYPWRAGRLGS